MKTKAVTSPIIDERVILTMIACSIIALIVLGFRYINDKPEAPVSISVSEGTLYANQPVTFVAHGQAISSQSLVWNFGDKSDKHDRGATVFHTFPAPGRYDVLLTVNGKRREYKTIYITEEAPVIIDPKTPVVVQFICPEKARVGEPVTFKDYTPGANKWEWWFGENRTPTPEATEKEVRYTFNETGFKTVTLIVNGKIIGKNKIFIVAKQVVIPPKPPTTDPDLSFIKPKPDNDPLPKKDSVTRATEVKPSVPKAPNISKGDLENRLRQVVDGKLNASDFSEYLSIKPKATVNFNGEGMTFETLCSKLREIKKSRRIKTLEVLKLERDENNFIISMNVSLDRKFISF